MSQVFSGAGRPSGLGRHIADVVTAPGGRLIARAHDGRADIFRHRQRGPHADSVISTAASQDTPVVFVVDDDVSVRESLELLIGFAGWRPETFASAQEFLARPRTLTPSCLVLDVSLPDLNGLDLQKLVAGRTDMPVIFITGYGDIPTTVRAMKAGAVEFLTKPFDDEALLGAIRHAVERSRAALGNELEIQALRGRYASLTSREREVMALVVSGLLNKQVGLRLGISEITVKAHRGRVMQKMKADSLADLVKTAERLRLAPAANP
jgi:FixJ family two-component response regulator